MVLNNCCSHIDIDISFLVSSQLTFNVMNFIIIMAFNKCRCRRIIVDIINLFVYYFQVLTNWKYWLCEWEREKMVFVTKWEMMKLWSFGQHVCEREDKLCKVIFLWNKKSIFFFKSFFILKKKLFPPKKKRSSGRKEKIEAYSVP